MAVSLSSAERRAEKVAAILATAASWVQVIDGDGESTWLVPSQSNDGVYSVDLEGWCDCPDALRRIERGGPRSERCKHGDAVLAWLSSQPVVDPFALTEEQREQIGHDCGLCNRWESCHCPKMAAYCGRCVGVAS
jgi:hypothetical protein